jgi:hypothetical protein
MQAAPGIQAICAPIDDLLAPVCVGGYLMAYITAAA